MITFILFLLREATLGCETFQQKYRKTLFEYQISWSILVFRNYWNIERKEDEGVEMERSSNLLV